MKMRLENATSIGLIRGTLQFVDRACVWRKLIRSLIVRCLLERFRAGPAAAFAATLGMVLLTGGCAYRDYQRAPGYETTSSTAAFTRGFQTGFGQGYEIGYGDGAAHRPHNFHPKDGFDDYTKGVHEGMHEGYNQGYADGYAGRASYSDNRSEPGNSYGYAYCPTCGAYYYPYGWPYFFGGFLFGHHHHDESHHSGAHHDSGDLGGGHHGGGHHH